MAKKMGHMETAFRQAAGARLPSTAAKKKKTGPISAGGVAQLKTPSRGGGGGFLNFKKLFSSM
jgi:hypothetical protein